MSNSLWLPFWFNIALLLCAIPTISLLPSISKTPTLSTTPDPISQDPDGEAGPLLQGRSISSIRHAEDFESHASFLQSILHATRKMRRLVTGRRKFQVLLCSFFLTALASSDTKLLVQYISKRYEWTFAQAGYMLSAKALVNFTLLAIIVPRIIRTSMSSKTVHGSEVRLNIIGAEVSIAVSVVGVLCVALASRFWMLLAGTYMGW